MLFSLSAFQTFSAVAGIVTSVPIASTTAFITAGGDAIAIASPPAVMNAVVDAIGTEVTMPATAEKVWKALKEKSKSARKAA